MVKPKVYLTRIGFHDAVVAAPNQKAALAVWDIRENLFAQGSAAITDDPQAVKAATARPGVVLRRPAGSGKPFVEVPDTPDAPELKPKATTRPAASPPRPAPDRGDLSRAEKALADFAVEETAVLKALADRKRALETEAHDTCHDLAARRRGLETARDKARKAYERQSRT